MINFLTNNKVVIGSGVEALHFGAFYSNELSDVHKIQNNYMVSPFDAAQGDLVEYFPLAS